MNFEHLDNFENYCDETKQEPQITFGQWLKEWYETYKKPYIKSYKNIERTIRLHIPRTLKSVPLSQLMPIQLQKAINDVCTTRTALDVFDVINSSLTQAFHQGYCKHITY